jgi:hypothetical protein
MKIINIRQKIDHTILTLASLAVLTLVVHSAMLFTEWNRHYSFQVQNIFLISPREEVTPHVIIKEVKAQSLTQ